jgi:uncharacterized protein YkwD
MHELVARPPRARSFATALLFALTGCYTGTDEPIPWMPGADDAAQDGTDDADDDGGDDAADDANDSAADDANDSAADDAADDANDSAADDANDGADSSPEDSGTDDGAGTDGGSLEDGGVGTDDGADSADDGGASDVPDNEYCMEFAARHANGADLEQQILDIVNQRRSEGANCGSEGNFAPAGPLTMNPALRCAARKHSKQMVEEDFFDHTTPWGESPGDRIGGAGYNGFTWGENIAAGNSTAAATMDQWMNSDGHCANIMNPDFEDIGVGYYPGGGYGHYWTQNFGTP